MKKINEDKISQNKKYADFCLEQNQKFADFVKD